MTRPAGSEVSTGFTAEIHIIWMIPYLVANPTDITSLCIYHQGSSDGRPFELIQNNLIPIVLLPYDIIFMGQIPSRVKNTRVNALLFGKVKLLRVAKVKKHFVI